MSATESERSIAVAGFMEDFHWTLDQRSIGDSVKEAVDEAIEVGGFTYRIDFDEDKSAWLFFEAKSRSQRLWSGGTVNPDIYIKQNFYAPVVKTVDGPERKMIPDDWDEFPPLSLKRVLNDKF